VTTNTARMRLERQYMRLALRLARRGYGATSPNPMGGGVLVKGGKIIGGLASPGRRTPCGNRGAPRRAAAGHNVKGATLYVNAGAMLHARRTPPCTEAILAAEIKRVVAGTI